MRLINTLTQQGERRLNLEERRVDLAEGKAAANTGDRLFGNKSVADYKERMNTRTKSYATSIHDVLTQKKTIKEGLGNIVGTTASGVSVLVSVRVQEQ